MARVNLSVVTDHMESEVTGALEKTFRKLAPGVKVSRSELFREFERSFPSGGTVSVSSSDVRE
jgi:hypothetical protein